MNRRNFLTTTAPVRRAPAAAVVASGPPETISRFANTALPTGLARASSTLAPYAGPWGYNQAAHLLRRTMFGSSRAQMLAAAGSSLAVVLNNLLTAPPAPAPPLNVSTTDTSVPIGSTWVGQPYNVAFDAARNSSLLSWWTGLMLNQGSSMQEKMTLFWHNHFVTATTVVDDSGLSYDYVRLLRQHALGNVKQLAKDITIAPAMLRYLNGNASTAAAPNENYGRELLELFTLGKGPLIGPGNYSTYTEADVQAAARVLTGWRDQAAPVGSYFTASRHDATTKQFSAAFGNATIAPNGAAEYQDLINLIFQQTETARFLVRKLYRWFVYYVVDAQVETDIIQPLATLLVTNNYDIVPVLRALFGSQHFFDTLNRGCLIKSPLDFGVGMARQLEMRFPPASSVVAQYGMWLSIEGLVEQQQQRLGNPPNVAGWAAYYQSPQFHEMWINAVTLPRRNAMTDYFISPGLSSNGYLLAVNAIALALALPGNVSGDPNYLIDAFVALMVPIQLTPLQIAFLKGVLLPGLPDFEWSAEWSDFVADPTDAMKKALVEYKLKALLKAIMGLAEYHLS